MHELELLIRGIIAGLIIAAPVGPVNVLCMHRTILHGWRAGVISGLGSASADVIYGAIAGFSISFIIDFLIEELFWIRLFGGILLMTIGVWYFFRNPGSFESDEQDAASDFRSTFFLTLTNPTTVLSFLAVLAALGMAQHRQWWLTTFLVAGIFAGSMLWWMILATIMSRLRGRFNDRGLVWMNRIGGIAIGAFGIVSFLLRDRSA